MTESMGVPILIADDSKDDIRLIERAFAEAKVFNPVDIVHDGQALLDHLEKAEPGGIPAIPGLILLDLNMPVLDGREALQAIRADPRLAPIPVLILSTSDLSDDVISSYRLGANAVLVKPFGYGEFVAMVESIKRFWLERACLPVLKGPPEGVDRRP